MSTENQGILHLKDVPFCNHSLHTDSSDPIMLTYSIKIELIDTIFIINYSFRE